MEALATKAGIARTTLRSYLVGTSDLPVGRLSALLAVMGHRLSIEPVDARRRVDASDLGGLLQAARDAAAAAGVDLDIRIIPTGAKASSGGDSPVHAAV